MSESPYNLPLRIEGRSMIVDDKNIYIGTGFIPQYSEALVLAAKNGIATISRGGMWM